MVIFALCFQMAKSSNRSLYHSDYDESDSCDSVYDGNSSCSQLYRQTQAKVRFTRTTSKIHHHLEASRIDGGSRSHLLGCLRRTSSSKSLTSLYMERNHDPNNSRMATDDDYPPTAHYKWNERDGIEPIYEDRRKPSSSATATAHLVLSSEKRRQELEETREEIKRLDALLLKQQHEESSFETQSQATSSVTGTSPQQHISSLTSCPDEWIDQLSSPTTGTSRDDDFSFGPLSSSSSPSCWNWCIKSDPSSWPAHVDLEPFTGEAKDWPKFIRRFKILIHDAMPNDRLRMIYLEELVPLSVKDEFYSLFGHLSSYPLFLAHLKDYYGCPHVIARSCFQTLKQLPKLPTAVDPTINTKTMQDFVCQLDDVVATLRLIGFEGDLRAFATLELTGLIEKLPSQLRHQWQMHLVQRPPLPLTNLVEFTSWLKERVEATCWR